jgi:1-deoxy-D-xylulose-5-phosphate synthase
VIGDGALTGGMAWEALNNIAVGDDLKLVVVVNDNGRSTRRPWAAWPPIWQRCAPTGATSPHSSRSSSASVPRRSSAGRSTTLLHGFKTGVKDILAPQGMFNDLGLKYIGPIDGHDEAMVERALESAKNFGGPVLVHCITVKGKGFRAAEEHEADRFHAVGLIDSQTGEPLSTSSPRRTWTDAFPTARHWRWAPGPPRGGGHHRRHAAPHRPGMTSRPPSRIASSTSASPNNTRPRSPPGWPARRLHPVVALYATFLNRAFDQVLMDVALHRSGRHLRPRPRRDHRPRRPSHHGMWDTSLMALVPGLHLAAPRDEPRLRVRLGGGRRHDDAPSVIRYSKDPLPDPLPAVVSHGGGVDVLASRPRRNGAPRRLRHVGAHRGRSGETRR